VYFIDLKLREVLSFGEMIEWWLDGMPAHVQNNSVEWLSIQRVAGME